MYKWTDCICYCHISNVTTSTKGLVSSEIKNKNNSITYGLELLRQSKIMSKGNLLAMSSNSLCGRVKAYSLICFNVDSLKSSAVNLEETFSIHS